MAVYPYTLNHSKLNFISSFKNENRKHWLYTKISVSVVLLLWSLWQIYFDGTDEMPISYG